MFNDCNKLKYIDFSNFSTVPFSNMDSTFHLLSSLVYLNIPTIEKFDNSSVARTFGDCSSFLTICSTQEKMKKYISNINLKNNCNHDCFKKKYENRQ